jgi:UDP-glucose 4-epimerase
VRILITGGAGYVGAGLTERLLQMPAVEHVTVYDNLSRPQRNFFTVGEAFPRGKLTFVEGELLDSRSLERVTRNVDLVFHLAARVTTPFADESPHLFDQTNNWGTAELVYAIEQSEVAKLVYLSSAAVYGFSSEPVGVHTTPHPITPYGSSKLRGEGHVERLSAKRRAHIARCGTVYGHGRCVRFDTVVNRFVFDANFSGRITIHGDGQQCRPFIHLDQVVKVLASAVDQDLPAAKFDLVDRTLSVNDLVTALRRLHPNLELLFANQHLRLRDLKVTPDPAVRALCGDSRDLVDELRAFRDSFTF